MKANYFYGLLWIIPQHTENNSFTLTQVKYVIGSAFYLTVFLQSGTWDLTKSKSKNNCVENYSILVFFNNSKLTAPVSRVNFHSSKSYCYLIETYC